MSKTRRGSYVHVILRKSFRWFFAASSCRGKRFGIQDLEILGLGFDIQGFKQVALSSAQCEGFPQIWDLEC